MDTEIIDKVVRPADCGPWGCDIGGTLRPAGYKYKVRIKKQKPEVKGAR